MGKRREQKRKITLKRRYNGINQECRKRHTSPAAYPPAPHSVICPGVPMGCRV